MEFVERIKGIQERIKGKFRIKKWDKIHAAKIGIVYLVVDKNNWENAKEKGKMCKFFIIENKGWKIYLITYIFKNPQIGKFQSKREKLNKYNNNFFT